MKISSLSNLQENFLCGICYSQVDPQNEPLECSVCRNHLYCKSCVDQYAETKTTHLECPYCNQPCKFVPVSKTIMDLLVKLPLDSALFN